MSARTELVATLRDALPADWTVLDHARELNNVRRPTVMVETTTIAYGVAAGVWGATVAIFIVSPFEGSEKAEDFLEDGVLTVVKALHELSSTMTTADRVEIGDNRQRAFRINLTYAQKKE
jgi:ABC-type transporter lipoprotein component MlaA